MRVGRTMFTTPDPEMQAVEASILAEQREVNTGVRSTFASVHSTLRSQGAAIRGLEDVVKHVLPELDRLAASERSKASDEDVLRLGGELAKLADGSREAEEWRRQLNATLESKFDAALGQRALEALARQQHQAEQEAAAREAVGGEVVRLAASCASFASLVEAVRTEGRNTEPRIGALERRVESAETAIEAERTGSDRKLSAKADASAVEQLARRVAESEAAQQKRHAKVEAEARKLHTEAMRAVEGCIERKDAQHALDALAEQIARQAHEHAQASARLAEVGCSDGTALRLCHCVRRGCQREHRCHCVRARPDAPSSPLPGLTHCPCSRQATAARVERAEQAAQSAQSAHEGEVAERQADLQANVSALQVAVEDIGSQARSQLRIFASSADQQTSELKAEIERLGEQLGTAAAVRAEFAALGVEVSTLGAAHTRTLEEIDEMSRTIGEMTPTVERLSARGKSHGQALEGITSQLQVGPSLAIPRHPLAITGHP